MHLTPILRLYPPAWRTRYALEMRTILESRPASASDAVDLLRGAADAWAHPRSPTRLPALSALAGGGLWTVAAVTTLAQPAPPDWPFYLIETVPLAIVGSAALLPAIVACAGRAGDEPDRLHRAGTAMAVLGLVAWMGMLLAEVVGLTGGAAVAAASTAAMIGVALIGLGLVRGGDLVVGGLMAAGSLAMLVPLTIGWLAFGSAWTAIGVALLAATSPTWPMRDPGRP